MSRRIDPNYGRRQACQAFAYGVCIRNDCVYDHALVNVTRFLRLVGLPERNLGCGQVAAGGTRVCLTLTYEHRAWSVRLEDGGPAILNGEDWSIEVQPSYPIHTAGDNAVAALKALEIQVFGRIAPPSVSHAQTIRPNIHSTDECEYEGAK